MIIDGTASDDSLDGTAGDDEINGFGGNDTLTGGDGADTISGGVGADIIIAGTLPGDGGQTNLEALYGGDGDDIIYSASASDRFPGYDSTDSYYYVIGGSGNDSLVGNTGNEIFIDDSGQDTIIGGGGRDIYLAGADRGTASLFFPDEVMFGYTDTPIYLRRIGDTVIDGAGDIDTLIDIERVDLTGGNGDDILINENAGLMDALLGNAGADFLYLNGNVSSSDIDGGPGADIMIGGPLGRNIFRITDGDVVAGGGAPDTFDLSRSGFHDLDNPEPLTTTIIDFGKVDGIPETASEFVILSLFDSEGDGVELDASAFKFAQLNPYTVRAQIDVNDDGVADVTVVFYGFFNGKFEFNKSQHLLPNSITFDGENTANYVTGLPFDDILDGSNDGDMIFGFGGSDILSGGAEGDVLFGGNDDDTLYGSVGDDHLNGENGNDFLSGAADNDVLSGGADEDTLSGGSGNDSANGGDGDDSIDGGIGDDYLVGSTGADTIIGDDGFDRIYGGSGNDVLAGWAGDDFISGGVNNDILFGGGGDDELAGGANNDSVMGGDGNDLIYGAKKVDTLEGGAGNDTISGAADNDFIDGGADDDTLFGGRQNDLITGGAGDDLFLYNKTNDYDVITDFTAGAGSEDVIQLNNFGAAFDTFAEVIAAAVEITGDTYIDFGDGDIIILQGVLIADLHQDDFTFG